MSKEECGRSGKKESASKTERERSAHKRMRLGLRSSRETEVFVDALARSSRPLKE
jgi:hypothetical protein